jgi:nucleoid DNA-binding protein
VPDKLIRADLYRSVADMVKDPLLTLPQAKRVTDAVLQAIKAGLQGGKRVELRGFGSFRPRAWAGRKVTPPGQKRAVKASDSMTVSFIPGENLRAMRD